MHGTGRTGTVFGIFAAEGSGRTAGCVLGEGQLSRPQCVVKVSHWKSDLASGGVGKTILQKRLQARMVAGC